MVKLVLDTNLLILYFLGIYRPEMISSCNFTSNYSKEDFILLKEYIKLNNIIYITPQIIAELSNQSNFLKEPGLKEYLKLVINELGKIKEDYVPLTDLLKN